MENTTEVEYTIAENGNLVPLTIIDTSSLLSDNNYFSSNAVVPLSVPETARSNSSLQPSDIDSLGKEQDFLKGLTKTLTMLLFHDDYRSWIILVV